MRFIWLCTLWLVAVNANAADLTGKVMNPDNQPVAGATVCVYSAAPKKGAQTSDPFSYPDCTKTTVSDAEGGFTIAGVDDSLAFDLLVASDEYRPLLLKKVDPARGPSKAKLKAMPADVDPELLVKGRIVDSAGNAITGAKIEISSYGNANSRTYGGESSVIEPLTYTNAKGEFTLIAKKGGLDFNLLVHAPYSAPTIVQHVLEGADPVDHALSVGATVTGRIVKDGQPLSGVKLLLIQVEHLSETWLSPETAFTNDQGQFTFHNVHADTAYDLGATMKSMAGRGALAGQRCTTTGDDTTVDLGDLNAEAGFTLSGQIVAPEGKPNFTDAKAQLSNDSSWGDSAEAAIDQDGHFEFKAAAPDTYSLTIKLTGFHLSKENVSADHYPNGPRMLMGRIDSDITGLKVQFDPGPAEQSEGDRSFNSSSLRNSQLSGVESK